MGKITTQLPRTAMKFRKYLPSLLGVLLPLLVLFIVRWGFLCVGAEYEPDCFFHARIVEEGPAVFFGKAFPWLAQSTWGEYFSDKELLFHCLLWCVTRFEECFVSPDSTYPFHVQVLFFDALFLTACQVFLYRKNVRHPWIYTLLLVVMFPPMTYRLISLRAYLFSMTIATTLLIFLTTESFLRSRLRWLVLLCFGFFASWSYSSPHLLLTTIVPFAFAEFLHDRKFLRFLQMPLSYLAGIALGLLIHPQFPNTLRMFKIQCIDVILAFFLHTENIPVKGGAEFYRNTLKLAFQSGFFYPVVLIIVLLLLYYLRKKCFAKGWTANIAFNGLLFTVLLNQTLGYAIYRFNEYAMIPLVLLLGVLVREKTELDIPAKGENDAAAIPYAKWEKIVLVLIAGCTILLTSRLVAFPPRGMNRIPAYGVAKWAAQQNLPAGTRIANLIWSDFPMLYYPMPQFRYSWGLDPAFTWYHSPAVPKMLAAMEHATDETKVPPAKKMKEAFQARYLYISPKETIFAEMLYMAGYILVYQDWDGCIFDLDFSIDAQRKGIKNPPLRNAENRQWK